jgi:fluoroacetyl-CoA thioesterase
MEIEPGLNAEYRYVVTDGDTAVSVGSGDVDVLGTPRLLALAEAATVSALAGRLAPNETSVGTRVSLEHLRPSAVGDDVIVRASVAHVDGRLVRFDVTAEDRDGAQVAYGQITRVVVDRDRFAARLARG